MKCSVELARMAVMRHPENRQEAHLPTSIQFMMVQSLDGQMQCIVSLPISLTITAMLPKE